MPVSIENETDSRPMTPSRPNWEAWVVSIISLALLIAMWAFVLLWQPPPEVSLAYSEFVDLAQRGEVTSVVLLVGLPALFVLVLWVAMDSP